MMRSVTRPRVLWLDDDLLILKSVSRILRSHCDVVTVDSVDQAIAEATAGEFEVFVSDLRLGEGIPGGFEAARRVLALPRKTPLRVVIYSGLDDPELPQRAAAQGYGFIHKREHPTRLREAILRAANDTNEKGA
jgi:CheY-like chemotaxis protein